MILNRNICQTKPQNVATQSSAVYFRMIAFSHTLFQGPILANIN